MPFEQALDPFSSKGIVDFGDLLQNQDGAWNEAQFDTETEYLRLSEVTNPSLADLRTQLLSLDIAEIDLQDLGLGNESLASVASSHSNDDSSQAGTSTETDVWAIEQLSFKSVDKGLLTWDNFDQIAAKSFERKYITETTAAEFDDLQSQWWQSGRDRLLDFADENTFHIALTNLIFGRSSAFFTWNNEASHFELNVHDFAVTGCSPEISAKLCHHFSYFGARYRRLRNYSQNMSNSHPTEYAFQCSLQNVLQSLELHVTLSRRQQAWHLRILEEVEKMTDLLSLLEHIAQISASLSSELDFLSTLVTEIENSWMSFDHLRPILAVLLSEVAEPAIRQTQRFVGLRKEAPSGADNEDWLFKNLLPEHLRSLAEVNACLAILEDQASDVMNIRTATNASLYLAHSWTDLIDIQNNAYVIENDYQTSRFSQRPEAEVGVEDRPTTIEEPTFCDPFSIDFDFVIPNTLALAAKPLQREQTEPSMSHEIAHLILGTTTDMVTELSPIQAIHYSLGPIIDIQHKTTSFMMLRAMFLHHNLKAHLNLLSAFFLVSSGSFAIRLTTALFDSSQGKLEDNRKAGLSGGLRLENREAWPPASSELRLVLNGILSETMPSTVPARMQNCISFAIKDLTDDEAELCRNTQSIHALNFLRIAYSSPDAMLESVITPAILEKYDRIFTFILTLLRMHTLCQSLVMGIVKAQSPPWRTVYKRFCYEANHFVRTVLDYAIHYAILLPQREFQERIQIISDCVAANDYQGTVNSAKSVSQLCQDHADTLDDILKGLLLKQKHAYVLKVLHEMFDLLLMFASSAKHSTSERHVRTAYDNFRQLRQSWYHAVEDISKAARDPALQRLQVLLLQIDLSDSLGLADRA